MSVSCFKQKRARRRAQGQVLWSWLDWAVTSNHTVELQSGDSHFGENEHEWILTAISSTLYTERLPTERDCTYCPHAERILSVNTRKTGEDKTHYTGHQWGGSGARWVPISEKQTWRTPWRTSIHTYMLLSVIYLCFYPSSHSLTTALTGWGGGEEDRRSGAVCQEALCHLTHPERSWVEALNRLWICSSAVWVRFTWTECFHTWEGNTGEPSKGSRSSQLPKVCNWAKKQKAALQHLTGLPEFSLSGNKVASQPSGGRSVGAVSSSWGETNPKTPLYAQIGLHLSVFSFVF